MDYIEPAAEYFEYDETAQIGDESVEELMTNINFSNDDDRGVALNLEDALYESSDKATSKTKSRVKGLMNSSTYSIKSGTL